MDFANWPDILYQFYVKAWKLAGSHVTDFTEIHLCDFIGPMK